MNAILSEKGQVTIPKRLRDDLGLKPGAVLEFDQRSGAGLVRQVMGESPIQVWRGREAAATTATPFPASS